MVGGGVWLWWAYRTYDICTLLSLQYLGREGGGGLVGNNTLQLKFSSICFYCIISSKPWGGGGGADLIILVICTCGGGRGGVGCG